MKRTAKDDEQEAIELAQETLKKRGKSEDLTEKLCLSILDDYHPGMVNNRRTLKAFFNEQINGLESDLKSGIGGGWWD